MEQTTFEQDREKMKELSYNEAYDKVIEAYFKGEMKPYNSNFCFCGNLCGNRAGWMWGDASFPGPYSHEELMKMEYALLSTLRKHTVGGDTSKIYCESSSVREHPNYENALFEGMCAAIEVLKEIHRERGENVDEDLQFNKRELKLQKD